jgi:tRNA-specific 2-thiouridylase
VWCNRYIKFAALWDQAERFGCQYIATGHYAQKRGNLLYAAVDLGKDQSYFLSQLTEDQRERALFPLGGYHKSEVRELATRFGLPTASKKDSQGLCFIGQLDLKSFLREEIGDESGGVFLLDKLKGDVSLDASDESSQQIAVSVPTRYYTIGERVGRLVDNFLYRQVTGETSVPPLYVAFRKGADLYCTPDPHDNVLACYAIEIADLMFLETTTPLSDCFCAVRYHQKECPLVATHEGSLLTFSTPQYAVAPGQLAVFSREDGLIVASGVITRVARGAEMRWDT